MRLRVIRKKTIMAKTPVKKKAPAKKKVLAKKPEENTTVIPTPKNRNASSPAYASTSSATEKTVEILSGRMVFCLWTKNSTKKIVCLGKSDYGIQHDTRTATTRNYSLIY